MQRGLGDLTAGCPVLRGRAPASSAVVLVGIGPPYRPALAEAARALGLACGPPSAAAAPALCVVALGGAAGPQRVAELRRHLAPAPLVALARSPDVDLAVRAVRAGACDVVPLPADPRAVARRALSRRLPPDAAHGLVGDGPAMRELRRRLRRLAPRPTTVLLRGETGTGKGEAARALHRAGPRPSSPFVHVDCAGLAPTLVESELFGHERGAFTGAVGLRRGRLEQAADGTLFLDEIAELPPALQARLLRALEERRFERVGGGETLALRARVVAATHVDLERAVAEGRFREDLLHRLDVGRLELPPLRERPEDLPALVRHGLDRLAARLELAAPGTTAALQEALAARRWPGNVRELLNVLERMLVLVDADPLDVRHLREVEARPARGLGGGPAARPEASPGPAPPPPVPPDALPSEEVARLAATLRDTGGNVARAARRLGVPRSTLRGRIARHGLGALVPRD